MNTHYTPLSFDASGMDFIAWSVIRLEAERHAINAYAVTDCMPEYMFRAFMKRYTFHKKMAARINEGRSEEMA